MDNILHDLIHEVDLPAVQIRVIQIRGKSILGRRHVQPDDLPHELAEGFFTVLRLIVLLCADLTPEDAFQHFHIISRQRDLIYRERQTVMESADLSDQIAAMAGDAADAIIDGCVTEGHKIDTQQFMKKLAAYNIAIPQSALVKIRDIATLRDALVAKFKALHEAHVEEFGETIANNMERLVLLRQVDAAWIDHLTATSQLRQGIGLRAYGQNDPVVEYSRESGELFDEMNRRIVLETVKALANLTNY